MPSARVGASRAFTTIELLVVISIILLLAGVVVYAISRAAAGMGTKAAGVTLGNLTAVLKEGENGNLLKRQPPGVWLSADSPTGVASYAVTETPHVVTNRVADFWRQPDNVTAAGPKALYSPGLVTRDLIPGLVPERDWRVSAAVQNTGIALAFLKRSSSNASLLGSLPNNTNQSATFWDANTAYPRGARVIYTTRTGSTAVSTFSYIARRDVAAGAANAPPSVTSLSAGNNTWESSLRNDNWELTTATVLDPWNNPVIFVPSVGLQVGKEHVAGRQYLPGERVYVFGSGVRTYYVATAATSLTPPASPWQLATPVRASDGRPFWASAGPDGDFDTPNDNVYSFDQ